MQAKQQLLIDGAWVDGDAARFAKTDPVSGEKREFATRRTLDAWTREQDQGGHPGNPPSASAPNSCRL